MEAAGTSICLAMKAVLLSARWAGRSRRLGLEQAASASGDVAEVHAENAMLRDTIEFLVERLACAEGRLRAAHIRKPYSLAERLHILPEQRFRLVRSCPDGGHRQDSRGKNPTHAHLHYARRCSARNVVLSSPALRAV